MKKVVITGVAGFVGTNLTQALLLRNYHVKGIDNFSHGIRSNIAPLLKQENFVFEEGDVLDSRYIESAYQDADAIIHLAAFKIPRYGSASQTLLINTKGTENVLNAAKINKIKVLFASTSDVYGKNPKIPFHENSDLLLGPTHVARWAYAVSKIYDEHLALSYHHEFNVPVTIVRYFGGYGPHQNLTWRGGPQSVFIEQALKGEPLSIHGDGKQTRSFTYISDIVEGTIAALEKKEANGQVFNIGNPEEISVLELAKLIWKKVQNHDPIIKFVPYENFDRHYEDVVRRVPDISKAKEYLNFVPKISLQDGLDVTIDWYRKHVQTKENDESGK